MNSFEKEIYKMIDDYLASLEKKIENNKRIIDEYYNCYQENYKKKKQVLMEDMKQKAKAKDDDVGSMLKLKIQNMEFE